MYIQLYGSCKYIDRIEQCCGFGNAEIQYLFSYSGNTSKYFI